MYEKSAEFYDAIYMAIGKDYVTESQQVKALLAHHARIPLESLLDVACGTGEHLVHLSQEFDVVGIDVNDVMLEAARAKLPDVDLRKGDMHSFELKNQFDAVICLFSAIGYAEGVDGLHRCMANFFRHTRPGGIALIEPWLLPEVYTPGGLYVTSVDRPDLKITRMNISEQDGRKSVMDMHHLVGTPDGIDYFVEHHELMLFTHEEYLTAMQTAGYAAVYDEGGLSGRGLYIGLAPQ